ncbi:beta-ketoacyl-ACP synthase III [Treponema pedis]|uniref:beta-ketoacyl-ACP synthase III n=1 Tax=Treponema pedis TaxID=409322 RepID=UPI0003FF830C|nr:beta-ketoacyl-ACP synthase III [Treponema pedis]
MSILIKGTGKALPIKQMENADFPAELDTSDEWIKSHTGISKRRIAGKEDSSASLACKACEEALKNTQDTPVSANEIDLILCATATPQFNGFPSNACLIQSGINAEKAVCFDVSAACSGFLYALDTAAAMMQRHNWRFALVCGSEVLSRIVDWNDRSTCVLFGDGAGAVLLENTFTSDKIGIGEVVLGSDGKGVDKLYLDEYNHIRMNGRAVYNFAVRVITETVEQLLEKEHLRISDVDFVVCHQANERILEAAAKRLGSGTDKFVCNIENYGNTSAASVPITLDDLMRCRKIKRGMTVIMAGFGAGLTWGGCVVRF